MLAACARLAQVQRGIFRFAFRVNGSGAGMVIGVSSAAIESVALVHGTSTLSPQA